MSEIIVLTPTELERLISSTVEKTINACMTKITSNEPEMLLTKNKVRQMMKIGHIKMNQLLVEGKLTMHNDGRILKSSVDKYVKMC